MGLKHRVAHIVNPFRPPANSDLAYAQPITFETMRLAKEKAKDVMEVELLATTFEEDKNVVPDYFTSTSHLTRSVLDEFNFEKKIKLPFIGDILSKAFNESDAEYIIYTNIDIGLYPDFYLHVNEWLNEGYDALIINRKRIEPLYTKVHELDKIFTQEGKSHPGFDCFVFHRSVFEKMELEKICIGVPFIEITFSQNLFHLSKKFKLMESDRNTFHIGMEIFKNRAPKEYFNYNREQYYKAIKKLDLVLKSKNLPYSNLMLPLRIIKWGLHPCIPIKLGLKLEWRRMFGQSNLK